MLVMKYWNRIAEVKKMKYDLEIKQKIEYGKYHLNQVKLITAKVSEDKDEIILFANIHAFFWECRSILELVAQEVFDKKGDKSDRPNFFGAYEKHLKGKISYTDEKMYEKEKDKENSLLFYLNEYRNAISHRERPGRKTELELPSGTKKFKPHRYNKSTKLFDSPWDGMTWDKLLSDIFEMIIKIKDECYNFLETYS